MRKELDKYYTPAWMVDGLKKHVNLDLQIVFEPFCGDGAISSKFDKSITNDIDENVKSDYSLNMRLYENFNYVFKRIPHDWIITNPPYKNCAGIVTNALNMGIPIAMLLRLSFLEPCEDRIHVPSPDLLIVTSRYSFTRDGKNDSATTAWFVWYNSNNFTYIQKQNGIIIQGQRGIRRIIKPK